MDEKIDFFIVYGIWKIIKLMTTITIIENDFIENDFIENDVDYGDGDGDEQSDIFPNLQSDNVVLKHEMTHDDLSSILSTMSDTGSLFDLFDMDTDLDTVTDEHEHDLNSSQNGLNDSADLTNELSPCHNPLVKEQKIYDVVTIENNEYFYDKEFDTLFDSNRKAVGFGYTHSKSKFMFYEQLDVSDIDISLG